MPLVHLLPRRASSVRRHNRQALDSAEKATKLPRFYVPVIIIHRQSGLMDNRLPFPAPMRELSIALLVRAMMELHQGRLAGCENDFRKRPANPVWREFSDVLNSDSLIAQQLQGVGSESGGWAIELISNVVDGHKSGGHPL